MSNISMLIKLVRYMLYVWIALLLIGCIAQQNGTVDALISAGDQQQPESPISLEQTPMVAHAASQPSAGAFAMPGPYPATLEGFLQYTDLIVMATLGDMKNRLMYGYDSETGKPSEPSKEDLGYGISVADFTLEDVEILWASKTAEIDEPIILRVLWSDEWDEEGVKRWEESLKSVGIKNFATGDRYLFSLGKSPDGTYGITFDENRLLVDEHGVLHYSQMALPYPVPTGEFTEGERYAEERGAALTVDDLIRAAEEMAAK